MKNILIVVLLGTTIVFGALYVRETKNTAEARANVAGLKEKADKLQVAEDAHERREASLRNELDKARAETSKVVHQAAKSQSAGSASGKGAKSAENFGDAFAGMADEMSKNPELRESIKNQQKATLGPMTDKNYAKLFAQLKLTPEQSAALKDLVVNKQLAAADVGMSMLDPNMDVDKRAELTKEMKAANDEADAKIKEYLGDSNYAEFQDYEKSLPQRMIIGGLEDQLAGGTGLSDAQESALLKAMQQEQANFKYTTDLSDKSKFNGDFANTFTEDKVNTFLQESGQLNNQYLTRAESILTSDQLAAFKKYLDGQAALQKMGMQMAAKMFGGKAGK